MFLIYEFQYTAMHATLQQLRLFEAVARHASFTRAAAEVHLTQPTVSIQIKRLEENVGQPLFEQIGKRIYLTAAGEALYAASRDILARLVELDESLETLSGEVAGSLRISVVTSAKYFMPRLLGAFLQRYPRVEPRLKVSNRAHVLAGLARNEDDLYVMGQVPEDLDSETLPFLENVLAPVAGPDHPLAGTRGLRLEDLAGERLLVRESGSGTRKAVEQLFARRGLEITPYMELGSDEALKQGVIAGLGIAVLSLYNLGLELRTGELVVLDIAEFPLRRPWFAVYPRGKRLSRTAQSFLEFLQTEGEAIVQRHLGQTPPLKKATKTRARPSPATPAAPTTGPRAKRR